MIMPMLTLTLTLTLGGKDFEGCLVFDECHKAKNLG
jgi:hypothetical protein